MKGMRSLLAVWVAIALSANSGRAEADDIYAYEMDGKTWFSNFCPKKATKCKLVMKSWSNSESKRRKKPAAANEASSKKTGDNRDWKPPVAVRERPGVEMVPGGSTLDRIIRKASITYDIPEAFIRAVIEVESGYKVRALSYKGAMGLMQLMPETAADLGVSDPYDPYQNIMGGTKLLRILANRFDGDIPKVLAAYHAGGKSVADAEGIPFVGTDGYVRKVLDHYYRLKGKGSAEAE